MAKRPPRSLYDCLEAHVQGTEIICQAEHDLGAPISVRQLARGDPLELKACQRCDDFWKADGPPLSRRDKGWARRKKHKGGKR